MEAYDEFALLAENAQEAGLDFAAPTLRRVTTSAPSGIELSGLVWGDGPPQAVLIHGGAQNAHTWDTVALALDRPLLALDLPGHGHSAWRPDHDYRPQTMAPDVVAMIAAHAPGAEMVVGMSLGGLTALAAVAAEPALADHLVLVDITPGVNQEKAAAIVAFVDGPTEFESFDALLERTMAHNPTRSRSSLRRGILHNARERPDGAWEWRYDRPTRDPDRLGALDGRFADLWDAVSDVDAALLLLQGALSPVVDAEDVAELRRRRADAEVMVVEGAGHSIQGDQPLELARILAARLSD
ncbi:MAG TPA: alpha/beta hydrolase [Acidimicrobiales bacterium]